MKGATRANRADRSERAPGRRGGGQVAYLSGQEVASLLHVSRATVSRWARAGQLPCVRTLGGHRRYSAESVIEIATELGWPTDGPNVDQPWS